MESRYKPSTNTPLLTRSFAKDSRQQKRHRRFVAALRGFRETHASGAYSYAEGYFRQAVRKIARKLAASQTRGAHV